MGKTKEIAGYYSHIREEYLIDIDLSGGIFLEMQEIDKPKLEVIVTNFGTFYKAKLNEVEISKEKLFEIIGLKGLTGFRLDFHIREFEKSDSKYQIKITDMNVS